MRGKCADEFRQLRLCRIIVHRRLAVVRVNVHVEDAGQSQQRLLYRCGILLGVALDKKLQMCGALRETAAAILTHSFLLY